MPVRAFVLVALLLCLATGMAAHADGPRAPAEVARDGPYALFVQDEDEQICLNIDGPGGDGFSCFDSEGGAVMRQEVRPGVVYVGAVVLASVVRVEFQRAGRPLGGGPTVAGEKYRGRAQGTLRFVLARLTPGSPEDGLRVRGYDAAGALVSVSAPRDSELVVARRRALSGRSSGVRWSVFDDRRSRLTPSVLDLAHETIVHCVRVNLHGRVAGEGSRTCSTDSPRVQFEISLDVSRSAYSRADVEDRCRPRFRLLHGVVPGAVTEVGALLGDGSVRAARTVALDDGQRAYALGIAPASAVRSVTLRTADGATEVLDRRFAPLSVDCSSPGGSVLEDGIDPFSRDDLPAVTPAGPVASLAGPPPARVADGPGDSLCIALGERPFTALGCTIVSPRLGEMHVAFDAFDAPRAFVFALPARVAAVRFPGRAGSTARTFPTVAGEAYSGRYAGQVRFALGRVSSFRQITGIELLDAAGRVLYSVDGGGEADVDETGPPTSRTRRLAGRRGAPSLWQTTIRDGRQTLRCLALTAGPRPSKAEACEHSTEDDSVLLDASCSTRRLTVAVKVRPGFRVFAQIGTRTTRRLRLRDGAGLLTLASGTRLRALVFVRKGRRTRPRLDAPPGAKQCGWRAAPTFYVR